MKKALLHIYLQFKFSFKNIMFHHIKILGIMVNVQYGYVPILLNYTGSDKEKCDSKQI